MASNLTSFTESLKYAAEKLGIPHFRQHQEDAIFKFLNGSDVFLSLPTNYGKSKIFQGIPLCKDFLNRHESQRAIAVVVSPIVAIIEQQVTELNDKGIPALHVRVDSTWTEKSAAIKSGQYSILYGSPETFSTAAAKDLLASFEVRTNICGIFIDESHCIEQWGYSSTSTTAFRESYSKLADLRALIPSKIPVMALTATATSDVRRVIIDSLALHAPCIISESPDRENIKYISIRTSQREPHKSKETFHWLIARLKREKNKMDRLIIYCRNRSQCTSLFGIFEEELQNAKNFAMCHGGTDPEVAKQVVSDFEDKDGQIRLLFATVAFGMGVDVKGVHTILHLGVPNTVGDYVQESGRAGRDGQQSVSVILCYPGMFKDCRASKEMKAFIQNTEKCRRKLILEEFDDEHPHFQRPNHTCCDICTVKCICADGESCQGFQACFEETEILCHFGFSTDKGSCFAHRKVSQEQLKDLEEKLMVYRTSLFDKDATRYLAGGDVTTGFPMEYIHKILKESNIAYPYEEFVKRCPMYDTKQSQIVWTLMCEVFSKCELSDVLPSAASSVIGVGLYESQSESESESEGESSEDDEENVGMLYLNIDEDDYNYRLLYSSESD